MKLLVVGIELGTVLSVLIINPFQSQKKVI